MNLREILRQTFATFRAHKMRMFLTMFGIVWGIASVILLVGLGRGFSVDNKQRMKSLGKDLVIVWGGRTSSQVGGLAAGREIHLAHRRRSPDSRRMLPHQEREPGVAAWCSRGQPIQLRQSRDRRHVAVLPGLSVLSCWMRAAPPPSKTSARRGG